MAKPKVAQNGSWQLSWNTYHSMPSLPFLIGVSVENPPQLAFTLSNDIYNRSAYLYNNPDRKIVPVGGWIVYIGGWVYLG